MSCTFFCTHLSLSCAVVSNSCESHELLVEEEPEPEPQDEAPLDHMQASALKFLYEAVNGAFVQSVFTSPPLVAQSSAFHKLEYILIGWLFGKGTPMLSEFLNSLIGVPSTENLNQD
ncbi:hypothetical protein Ahy_A01g001490 isoform E [Arachis hypogaea]|uniref:Uncharacterized protein n=1 Tax=Arachis hypogaea TaxID=3818 RepID=A0A445ENG9_ARAHY|nr:hypothetical protein Ahy_B01g055097 isoform D [Arachis hypogaea]RYR77000.1 hypothetical protein Ahy_A01g001490 isoform E [Arachis hypogaea]